MTPISLEKWQKFSAKQKWDILVTLRGPDQREGAIKWFTTSVIRHMMENVLIALIGKSAGGMINSTFPAIILPDNQTRYSETKDRGGVCQPCAGGGYMLQEGGIYKLCETCQGAGWIRPVLNYSKLAWFDLSHFADHMREAAMFLDIPVYYVPRKAWEEAMTLGDIRSTAKALIACTEDPKLTELLTTHGKVNGWWK